MSTTITQTFAKLASKLSAVRAQLTERRRRQAGLDGLMGLNDRALADIGVRRADVQAAMIGIVPAGRIWAPPSATAEVVPLRPKACRPAEADPNGEKLSAAA